MRRFDNSDLTPQDRFCEIARLLAVGVLRLRDRAALAADPLTLHPLPPGEGWGEGAPEIPEKTGNSCLELPAKTVLSVHTG
jgi:hypothetical protein